MNILAIAQRLRKEASVNGTGPSSVFNQSGEYETLCNYLIDAYAEVQRSAENWDFLRVEYAKALASGTALYTPTALGLTNLKNWIVNEGDMRVYLTATGVSDEQHITYVPWIAFKHTYQFGSLQSDTGRPTVFTIKPNNSIKFYPIPDAAYTLVGECFDKPDVFTLDTDEPIFPGDDFDLLIMWKALNSYGIDYVEANKEAQGLQEYKSMLKLLRFDQLPRIEWGEPLA